MAASVSASDGTGTGGPRCDLAPMSKVAVALGSLPSQWSGSPGDEEAVFWIWATATPLEMPSCSAPTPGATRATTAVALAVPLWNGVVGASAPDALPHVPARRASDASATIVVRP